MATQVGEGYIEVDVRINRRTLRDLHQSLNTQFAQMGDRSAAQFSQAFSRNVRLNRIRVEIDQDHLRSSNLRMRREMTNEGFLWGSLLGRHLSAGVAGVMSLLPSRLELLFTRTGPVIGTALATGLAAALTIAMPAIGAMAAGLFFAGFGFAGALAAIVVGAVNDQRVRDAWTRLGDSFKRNVINHPDVQHLGQVLADQLDKVGRAIERWGPHIRSILNAGARFMPLITKGMIGFVDAVLPAFDRMMNSPFVASLMDIVSKGIIKVGEALGISFDRFLNDPEAMEGAKLGLEDFFDLLAGGVKTIMDFIRWLSKMWYKLNNPDESGKSPLDKMRDGWKVVKDIVDDVVAIIIDIGKHLNSAFGPGSDFDKATDAWEGLKQDAKDYLKIVQDILNAGSGGDKKDLTGQRQSSMGSGNLPYGGLGQQGENRNGDAPGFGEQQGGIGAWARNQLADIKEEFAIAFGPNSKLNTVIKDWWNRTWGSFKAKFQEDWNAFIGRFKALGTNLGNAWNNTLNFFKTGWNNAWGYVKQRATEWWNNITSLFTGWVTNLRNWWNNALNWIKGVWNTAWGWVRQKASEIWNGIWNSFRNWWSGLVRWFQDRLNELRNLWNFIWDRIKTRAAEIWNAIWNTLKGWWDGLARWFRDRLQDLRELWNFIWDRVRQKAAEIWAAISAKVGEVVTHIRQWLAAQLDKIRDGWNKMWSGVHKFFEGIWEKIKGAAQVGINWVLGIIQNGINLINKALEKLGVKFRIPAVTNVQTSNSGGRRGGTNSFATGGKLSGPGTPTSDSIPIWASRDEYIIRAKSARKIGYDKLDQMNTTGMVPSGFATGGRVGGGNEGLMNEHRNHLHVAMSQGWQYIVALAKKSGFPVSVTSAYRPGDPLWHGKGKAVDFGGFNQDMLASYFMRQSGVLELIHRTNKQDYAIFGGKSAGGGPLSGIFQWLGKGWNWVLDHILRPAGNKAIDLFGGGNQDMMHALGHGSIKGIFNAVVDKAKVEFEEAEKMIQTGDVAGGGAQQWAGTALAALMMLKLPTSWLKPLLTLIARESGGNPSAINRWDSNAAKGTPSMGLMQTIGPTFNAYKLPGYNNILAPLDNILAGLRYIKARYGSIFNVQQAVGSTPRGYDNGGILGPGMTGVNMSRHPEMVLNNAQGAALEERIRGNGNDCSCMDVEVNIHADYYETVLRRQGQEVARQLKAGKKLTF